MIVIPRAPNCWAPGTWWPIRPPEGRTGYQAQDTRAILTCPEGHGASLTHTIAADGTVTPSVVCPRKRCRFHEYVRLEGWSEWLAELQGDGS